MQTAQIVEPQVFHFCSTCHIPKLAEHFHKHAGRKYDLQDCCKECAKIRQKQYYKDNTDKVYQQNKANKNKLAVISKEYLDTFIKERQDFLTTNDPEYQGKHCKYPNFPTHLKCFNWYLLHHDLEKCITFKHKPHVKDEIAKYYEVIASFSTH